MIAGNFDINSCAQHCGFFGFFFFCGVSIYLQKHIGFITTALHIIFMYTWNRKQINLNSENAYDTCRYVLKTVINPFLHFL